MRSVFFSVRSLFLCVQRPFILETLSCLTRQSPYHAPLNSRVLERAYLNKPLADTLEQQDPLSEHQNTVFISAELPDCTLS